MMIYIYKVVNHNGKLKNVLVLGGGGFIGHHLINRLIGEGCWVRGVEFTIGRDGSEEMISINDFVDLISDVAVKTINKVHIDGPLGVRGRNSDNEKIKKELNWAPSKPLREGIEKTYQWIEKKVKEIKE